MPFLRVYILVDSGGIVGGKWLKKVVRIRMIYLHYAGRICHFRVLSGFWGLKVMTSGHWHDKRGLAIFCKIFADGAFCKIFASFRPCRFFARVFLQFFSKEKRPQKRHDRRLREGPAMSNQWCQGGGGKAFLSGAEGDALCVWAARSKLKVSIRNKVFDKGRTCRPPSIRL